MIERMLLVGALILFIFLFFTPPTTAYLTCANFTGDKKTDCTYITRSGFNGDETQSLLQALRVQSYSYDSSLSVNKDPFGNYSLTSYANPSEGDVQEKLFKDLLKVAKLLIVIFINYVIFSFSRYSSILRWLSAG